jgi:hypothetical protein
MSEQVNADKAEERVSSESGLFISAEPLAGVGRLSATGDDSHDADASDSDSGITDDLTDADASDAEADADNTDAGGDATESESGLGGENPLGINRERVKNGDDKDTRDT